MEATLIKHALRAAAGGNDGYRPEGWNPKLRVTVMGPTPPDAELVWTMYQPDGSTWFEFSAPMPELQEEEMHSASMQKWESGTDITDAGCCRFTLRLVNELDGIDRLLHDGVLDVIRTEGSNEFFVDPSTWLVTGLVGLDVYDEHDAPKLRATAFFGGNADTYQVEAHLFHEGKRIAKASYVEGGYDFTSNHGNNAAKEFVAEFENVRGWNNLAGEGWGKADWHLLDANPGAYELKFTREGKIARTMAFTVVDGRIVADDLIEYDGAGRPTLWRVAAIVGSFDGDTPHGPANWAYGDLNTAVLNVGSDGMYWFCNTKSDRADVTGSGDSAAPAFDDETTERLASLANRAYHLLYTWESDMLAPDFASMGSMIGNFLLQCDVVVSDTDRFTADHRALAGVGDDQQIELVGETVPLAVAASRVAALGAAAASHLRQDAHETTSVLAPFRAILSHDKLALFEDHPAPDYVYYTTNRHVIETPDELAAAEFWFFEGASDTDASGTVDGQRVTAKINGWRVLGYRFDSDHTMIDEFEVQGTGASAPKSAFVGR